MAKKKIKLIKTYPSSRVPEIVEYTQSLINSCILMVLLLADLPITTAEWQAKLKIVSDAQLDVKARKRGARSIVIAGVFGLKQILYDVCNFVEKKCNEAGISTLADAIDNTPLRLVKIIVMETVDKALTNDDGNAMLKIAKAGVYSIKYEKYGYDTLLKTGVELGVDDVIQLDCKLTPIIVENTIEETIKN